MGRADGEAVDWDRERLARVPRRISIAARERGYATIFDLADAAGLSREALRKYRCGARRPTSLALIKLSEALRVPTDWLLGYSSAETAERVIEATAIDAAARDRASGA